MVARPELKRPPPTRGVDTQADGNAGGYRRERLQVGRRIFEALCEHYPDHYIALIEQRGKMPELRCVLTRYAALAPGKFKNIWGRAYERGAMHFCR